MKARITAIFATLALLLGGAAMVAPSASAGNGTSNYYLTGSCKAGTIGGIYLSATNWDYGPNQYYHLNVTRSGIAYQITGVYIDGKYLGKSLGEYQPWDGGHGRSYLYLTGYLTGAQNLACGFWL